MKKLLLFIMSCYTLAGCCGCDSPIQGKWKELPVRVCTENSIQDDAVNEFNKGIGFEFYTLVKNNCQVIIQTKNKISDFPKPQEGHGIAAFETADYDDSPFPIISHSTITALPESYHIKSVSGEDTDKPYKVIIAHELGHAAGHFFHIEDENGLMYGSGLKYYYGDNYMNELMTPEFLDWMNAIYPH